MSPLLLDGLLVCPRDGAKFVPQDRDLVCQNGHAYPVVNGIPVLLREDVEATHSIAFRTHQLLRAPVESIASSPAGPDVDAFVQKNIGKTCGHLYAPLVGRLQSYPIPELRLEPGGARLFLEVGCNWGRWCIAAARAGYRVVGVDPSIEALLAAQRVAQQLGVTPAFVAADARYLPFVASSFDVVFSYSVLQHFSKPDVATSLSSVAQVLKPGGFSLIQLANGHGIRSTYHRLRQMRQDDGRFKVRYWTLNEMKRVFEQRIGPSELEVDGFFSLNSQASDIDLLPSRYRLVVRSSEALRRLAKRVRWLRYFADSLYVKSSRRALQRVGA